MKIAFHGAAEEVTGSKHLITLKNGKKLLLDCGLFQGRGAESAVRNRHFGFHPASIDYLFLSHAHIDHSGNIPNLVRQGFRGKIFCTPATYDLCQIMLADSAHIQESDIIFLNTRRAREGKKALKPLYTIEDVKACWNLFHTIAYDQPFMVEDGLVLHFTDAGHILGSSVVNLTITEGKRKHRIAYTGDVGRYLNKILREPDIFPQANTIICEATYGNRLHESSREAKEKLQQAVYETCYAKRGKLIIPAFSIGKTQELIYILNKLEFKGQLERIKVFVDSPLAIDATEIMRLHPECFGEATRTFMHKDPDPFGFSQLFYVRDAADSKKINDLKEPCIIISASGMAEAGRVKHHLANGIEDPRNSVLIIGYCEPPSLSGRLLKGDRKVSIYGRIFDVKADIYNIDFFSAHADYNELVRFLSCQEVSEVENVFLVHGNKSALAGFKEQLSKKGFSKVEIARKGRVYNL